MMTDPFSNYDEWKLSYPPEWDEEYMECAGCSRILHIDDLDEEWYCEECRGEVL